MFIHKLSFICREKYQNMSILKFKSSCLIIKEIVNVLMSDLNNDLL